MWTRRVSSARRPYWAAKPSSRFRQLFEPVSSTYTYLLGCEDTGQALLIDPDKVIHAEGEQQAAQKLLDAAEILTQRPEAMQLCYLQTLTQIANERVSTIVWLTWL